MFQNAAHTVHLDGDIIHNQNEIRPYYAEGQSSGSVEDVRSVCSCTAFDPFRIKARRRLKKAARAARNQRRGTMETEDTLGGTRCSTTMKWYSTDSLHTKPQSPVAVQVLNFMYVISSLLCMGSLVLRNLSILRSRYLREHIIFCTKCRKLST